MNENVIQFIPSMNDGGAETLVKDYCILAKSDGFNMKIVTYIVFPNTANTHLARNNDIEIIHIYNKWNFITKIFHKFFGRIYISLRLKEILKKEKPEALHIHMQLLKYVSVMSKFLYKNNIKLFYTCHNLPQRYFRRKSADEYKSCKKLIRNNNLQLIALHDDMRKELNEFFDINNTVVIRNGIDFKRFTKVDIAKEKKRKELNIPGDAYVLGHIGRFDYQKNHKFLINIFSEVVKKKANAHLLLVGTGELENDIKNQIKDLDLYGRVTMLSNRVDIPELLKTMDVFIFPSMFEGLSVTMIEAQVVGLPCVVSDQINKETFCTNHITVLSLDASISAWADAVINPECNIESWCNMEDYDMNQEIHKLENLYFCK